MALAWRTEHGEGVPEHTSRPQPADYPPNDRLLDVGGGPSAYSLAQVTAERPGLTLHPYTVLEQCRQLQDLATELHGRDLKLRTRERARRVTLLAITAVALWLSVLIAVLNQQ